MKPFVFAFVFSFALFPFGVSAHGTGASYEAQVGDYFVDIGYSVAEPEVGEPVSFDFNLPDEHAGVAYADVWVRIDDPDGNVVLATGVHNAAFGGPRLSYAFMEEGTYTIHARYENGPDAVVETSFPITVTPASSMPGLTEVAFLVLGVLFGAVLAYFVARRKS